MMNEQEKDKLIAKGFNDGYLLNQFEYEVLDNILKSDNKDNAYINAMAKGREQHEREKIQERQQAIKEKNKEKKRTH